MICPPKKYDTDRDILGSDKARLARDAIIKDRQPPKPTMKSKEVEIDGKNVTVCWDDDAIIDMNVKPSVEVDGDVPPFVVRDLTKPTMADIERLVDDHETAIIRDTERRSMETCCKVVAARAGLMAAIRAYGEG